MAKGTTKERLRATVTLRTRNPSLSSDYAKTRWRTRNAGVNARLLDDETALE